jgi:hypothetical protein
MSSGTILRVVRRPITYALILASVVAALAGASTTSAANPLPQVTVIGDSILTAVQWNTAPMATLGQGFDLQMEIGVCRRIEGQSCPYEGGEVPTLVELVPQLGSSIAQTVIVEVGSNDPQDVFAQEVEDAMHVLIHYGATRVLWVNFHEVQGQYPAMNQVLVAAAQRYPQLSVVDWNAAAAGHPEWFQTDGIHLVYSGAVAMATLLHDALLGVGGIVPPPDPPLVLPATPLPAARAGRPYAARLVANGGTAPYHWQVTSGPLPKGLRLLANGRITGIPKRPGRSRFTFRVLDANGQSATRVATLVIARPS